MGAEARWPLCHLQGAPGSVGLTRPRWPCVQEISREEEGRRRWPCRWVLQNIAGCVGCGEKGKEQLQTSVPDGPRGTVAKTKELPNAVLTIYSFGERQACEDNFISHSPALPLLQLPRRRAADP